MNKQFDPHSLAARLERFGEALMTACEQGKAIENRIDVCAQISAVCRIVATLKGLRAEERLTDYASEFAGLRRAAAAGTAALADPGWNDADEE
jgi:hypothetical protein